RAAIEERLGKAVFNSIAQQALLKLTELTAEQQKFAEQQPLSIQRQVARNLTGNAVYLIGLMIKLGEGEGRQLYRTKGAVLDAAGAAQLYRSSRNLLHDGGSSRAPWLERLLETRLREAGCIVAQITEGQFTPRG